VGVSRALVEVLRIGNAGSASAPAPMYLVRVDGRVVDVRNGVDDVRTLAEVARAYPAADRVCTSDMSAGASIHGFRTVPWSPGLRAERAIGAVVASTAGAYEYVGDRDAIEALIVGTARLARVSGDASPAVVAISQTWLEGMVRTTHECTIVWTRSADTGIALFRSSALVRSFVAALASGVPAHASSIDRVSLTRVIAPGGFAHEVADLTGQSWCPQPWRWRDGGREPIGDAECRHMAAIVLALSSSKGRKSSTEVRIGSRVIATSMQAAP
jgi:hypothetical protein